MLVVILSPCPQGKIATTACNVFSLSCNYGLLTVPVRPLSSPLAMEPHIGGTVLLREISQTLGFPQIFSLGSRYLSTLLVPLQSPKRCTKKT